MKKNEIHKRILRHLIQCVECIADKKYQKRVWILGKGPEVDSFGETVNSFFDYIDCIFFDENRYNLSKDQLDIIEHFRDEFDDFSERHDDPEEFIDTPEWDNITKQAKEVLRAFEQGSSA